MSRDADTAETGEDPPEGPEDPDADTGRGGFDRQLLSDLSINVVPIVVIVAFVLVFSLYPSAGGRGDPLILFHAALVVGVVLVSAVAGWIITNEDGPLEGSVANGRDGDPDRDPPN